MLHMKPVKLGQLKSLEILILSSVFKGYFIDTEFILARLTSSMIYPRDVFLLAYHCVRLGNYFVKDKIR